MYSQNDNVQAMLHQMSDQFTVKLPRSLLFDFNEIRKSSIHKATVLTITNQHEKPLYVVKLPEQFTPLANQILQTEYEHISHIRDTFPGAKSIPKPLGRAIFSEQNFCLYKYTPHTMLYRYLYDTHDIFHTSLFTKPIKFLFNFNKHYANSNPLSKDFLVTLESDLNTLCVDKYEIIKPIVQNFWKNYQPLLSQLPNCEIPTTYMHGDFNCLNIGIKPNGQLIVFDWEDAQADYPVLFDFFYFVLGFAWYLFDARITKVPAETVAPNIKKLMRLTNRYLNKYMKEFGVANISIVNALYVLFMFHNLRIDMAEKRNSDVPFVERWLHLISKPRGPNYLTQYLWTNRDFFRSGIEQK